MANKLTLFCVLSGELSSRAFSVKVATTDAVDDLRKAIIKKNPNAFERTDPDDLVLWHVSIPLMDDDEDELPIMLDTLSEKKKLGPAVDLSDVFKEGAPRKTINIIVQQPSAARKRRAEEDDRSPKRPKTLEFELLNRELNLPRLSNQYRHEFYDRAGFFKTVIPAVEENYVSRGSLEHMSHTTFVVPGGSGIGKSRAGYELQRLVNHAAELDIKLNVKEEELPTFQTALENSCYLYVNLNNGCAYNDYIDENHGSSVRIGVRLAVAAGLSAANLGDMKDHHSLELFTIQDVIEEILKRRFKTGGRTLEALIIHIDEYQQYIQSAQNGGRRTWQEARDHFKEMLRAIGIVMSKVQDPERQFFIIPICTGTSVIDIHYIPSYYSKLMVTLPPLNYESALRMFRDNYRGSSLSDDVQKQQHFRIALNDTGYIPRFIDFLLKPRSLSLDYDWGNSLYDTVSSKYFPTGNTDDWGPQDDVRAIISLGLTRMQITRKYILPSKKTVGEVERAGLLYLVAADSQEADKVMVVMPFVLLKRLNRTLNPPAFPDDLLLIPTKERHWGWEDFDTLLGHYQKAVISALINVRDTSIVVLRNKINNLQEAVVAATAAGNFSRTVDIKDNITDERLLLEHAEAKTCWHLSEVFRGAKGSSRLLRRQVKLRELEVFREATKSLVLKDDVLPPTNSILCDDGERHELEEGIILSFTNNANLDCRFVLESDQGNPLPIFLQFKHSRVATKNQSFNHKDLKDWYDVILQSTRNHDDVVIVIITNRKYTNPAKKHNDPDNQYGPDGISDMPNLLLIDQSRIAQYLSPTFAHRGILAIPDDFQAEQIQSTPFE
ncbi:hypothetical protein BGZ99_001980 [Dissophora globulifera]|uniref:Crinkler effector protein N-terminal domain-containing protein n=1 Tax=Dissophora globulifera TaxID=979702 RepID=A0A9P6QX79_9FUNG|nr:hypothetical protein BGZ99_001980 [Dissophora globulifera]